MSLNVVFMGTPAFSVPVMDALVNAGHRIVAVYSQPPRPAGRGMELTKSPVHARAESSDLRCARRARSKTRPNRRRLRI